MLLSNYQITLLKINFGILLIFSIIITGCKSENETGCTDPTASNYNPKAKISTNNLCQYTLYSPSAVFYIDASWYDNSIFGLGVSLPNQNLAPNYSPSIIGGFVGPGAPLCGSQGCETLTLSPTKIDSQTISYTLTENNVGSWNRNVTLIRNQCTAVLLPMGNVTFYTSDSSLASMKNYPGPDPYISVQLDSTFETGFSISQYFTTVPNCGNPDCINYILPLGTYSYTANAYPGPYSNSTKTWAGSFTINSDKQCLFINLK